MSNAQKVTVAKMLDSLPPELQDRAVEHLREYVQELLDEYRWERAFETTQAALMAEARKAKEVLAAGKAAPMDWQRL